MTSPFAIFRKNQKIGMIFLTLMAMFAFVFLDTVGRSARSRGGRQGEVAVKLKTGNLDTFELQQLVIRRMRANEFVRQAFSRTIDMSKMNQMQFQQLQGRLQGLMFYLGQPSPKEDALMGYLLRLEAQKMGLIVTDEAVEGFIDEVTERRLSTEQLQKIVSEMHMSRKELFDCLRDELQARLAYGMQRPADPQSPDEYWKFFKQIKVEESIEVAGIPLSEFISQIPDPPESDLKKYFEAHKKTFPDGESGPKPGFKQPRRVKLQVLEASYEAAEKRVPEVTEAEVTEYYEKHKDELYLNFEAIPNESKPLDPKFAPEDGKEPDSKPADAETKEKAEPAPNLDADKGTDSEKKPNEGKADEGDKGKAGDKGNEQGSIIPVHPSQRSLAAQAVLTEAVRQSQIPPVRGNSGIELALQDDAAETKSEAAAESKSKAESKPADAEAANKPATPADGEKKPADEAKPDAPADTPAKPGEAAEGAPAKETTPGSAYRPLDETLRDEIRERLLRERTMVELKDKIGAEALNKLSDLGVKFNAPPAMDGPNLYIDLNGDGKWEPKTEPGFKPADKVNLDKLTPAQNRRLQEELAKLAEMDVKQAATELGTVFFQSPLVSAEELSKLPGIGSAVEANEAAAGPTSTTSIIEQVFSDDNVYRPMQAIDPQTQNLYAYWKIEDVPAHVPEYTEPGIKELVLATWKREKARPLAQQRAEALAKQVNESKKPMSEALIGQKVNEGKEALPLTVQTTPNFAWMREPAAPSQNPFAQKPPPVLSVVPYVTNIGNEFMDVVFDRLKPGEAGVAVNSDHSIYYVVQVEQRTPSTAEQMEELRSAFLKSDLFGFSFGGIRLSTPYQSLAEMKQNQMVLDWMKGLEKKYAVEWTGSEVAGKFGGPVMDD